MKNKTIGIIGIKGKYGQWLQNFFENFGYKVIGSDLETRLSNKDVVEKSDVVVFSIPMRSTVGIIKELTSFSREEQLWLDVTSLKDAPIRAMLESKASVIGLHPMVSPASKTWKGQTVVLCPARVTEKWLEWTKKILKESKGEVLISNPKDHDKQMIFVQALPHASQLIMAAVLRSMSADIDESLKYTSPIYRMSLNMVGRILAQNPNLYADIQMLNPNSKDLLETMERETKKLGKAIESGDIEGFIKGFNESGEHFGEENIKESFEYFEHLIKLITDLSEGNSITLFIKDDKPGTLHTISGILAEENINLTSFHSFPFDEGHKFHIGVDCENDSEELGRAIRKVKKVLS